MGFADADTTTATGIKNNSKRILGRARRALPQPAIPHRQAGEQEAGLPKPVEVRRVQLPPPLPFAALLRERSPLPEVVVDLYDTTLDRDRSQ